MPNPKDSLQKKLSELLDIALYPYVAPPKLIETVEEAVRDIASAIQDLADCHCRHCGQCFDSLKEAMKHERIGEDAHHINCVVDLQKVLELLVGSSPSTSKENST